jgi:hypothetical protein
LGAATACTGTVVSTGDSPPDPDTGGSIGTPSGGSTTPGAGGSGGTTSSGSGGTGGSGVVELNLKGSPTYYRVIRITKDQWINITKDLLGIPDGADLAQNIQDAVGTMTDFVNNENLLDVDQRAHDDFQTAAEALAAKVTATDSALAKVYSGTDAAGFISTFGRRAYRRPLTDAEKSAYMTLFSSGSTLMGSRSAFAKGASLVIRAMLQSPNFLYRTELTKAGTPLTAYEMAAKLSLWLRNTTPTDALLDSAAGPGKLDTADGAVAAAKTMVDDAAATKPVMRSFTGQYLHFDRIGLVTKVATPSFKPAIVPELEESSYLFFDKIFSMGLGIKEVFTSTSGFVGPNMAALYGNMSAPASGYVERDLGANRVGYFTQLPYLITNSHESDPDSIHRGVFMNFDVLCSTLGPPNITPPSLPLRMPGETNRQVVDKTTAGCGQQCHNQMINPIGFAFEHFDGLGQYRETEKNGNDNLKIDASGTFNFIDGAKSYKDATDLMNILAKEPQVHQCFAKKMASYGLQRDVIAADMGLIKTLATTSSNGSWKQVILDLVKQDAFRIRSGGAQ